MRVVGKAAILAGEMSGSAALAHGHEQEPEPSRRRDPAHVWRLDGATWAAFQRLLELRGEHPVPRFAYLEGSLEIMSPSRG
jgi:hypothetical protein